MHNIELIPGYGHAINYYLTTPWLAGYVRNPVSYETTETMNGIEMKFSKTYGPVSSGRFRIYLNSHLVDLEQPVTVRVNGETAFEGKVEPRLDMMAESCALFGDPQRVFPCGVDIDMSEL